MFITFYSSQGGVGKTSLLTEVALNLAKIGKNILLIDGCLNNPSLLRILGDVPDLSMRIGLLDLLLDLPNPRKLDRYVNTIHPSGYRMDILHAGISQNYGSHHNSLDLESLYKNHNAGDVLEYIRNIFSNYYDYILIDTPSGYTEIGGICVVQFADIVVPVFKEDLKPVTMIQDVKKNRRKLPYDRFSLVTIPVPRLEINEKIEYYCSNLFSNWLPTNITIKEALYNLYRNPSSYIIEILENYI